MATRIQNRRGTASEWTSANPVLAAGEFAWESDTNRFKVGNGTNNWADLDYFIDANSISNPAFGTSIVFEGATADSYETTLQITDPTADRTITLPDSTGTVALTSDITVTAASTNTFTNKSISLATNTVTGTKAEFNTAMSDADFATIDGTETLTNKTLTAPVISSISNGAATLTLPTSTGTVALTTDIPAGVVTESGTQTLTNKTLTSPLVSGLIVSDGSIVVEGATANEFETTLQFTDPTADRTITLPDATGTVQLRVADVSDEEIAHLNGVTSAIQTQIDAKASLSGATFTGAVSGTDLTLSGNLTVNGTTTNINSTNLVVEDKNIILGDTTEPGDATADGGGITLKGTTDKTFNWVDATDAWTSSEHINLASGKSLYLNGTLLKDVAETLTNKSLTTPVISSISNTGTLTLPTDTDTLVGRATTDTLTNKTLGSAVATTAFTLNATAELRLADTDSSHYVGFKAPGTVSSNKIWTLPAADGTTGQTLSTDGSGVLSWSTPVAGADEILTLMGGY
jgi:hypothetical protein